MSPLLKIENLETILHTRARPIRAVDGLTLEIFKGETFALVGESGCGKSMTALSIMRLLPEVGEVLSGSIQINGLDLLQLSEAKMREIRGKRISMIFQEPMLSLNPVLTIAEQISEVLKLHFNVRGLAAQKRILELLNQVGIPDSRRRMNEYPFQFSGGMKQRAMIAMALAGEPELLIADEPTTALDVTIQAQVLDLMRDLQQSDNMAILLITHDLGVVSEMAQRVAVMYAGEIVEYATCENFFQNPAHPYSQQLFASLPGMQKRGQPLTVINGGVPSLAQTFRGCRFAARCKYALDQCHLSAPKWYKISEDHQVRCHLFDSKSISDSNIPKSSQAQNHIDSVHNITLTPPIESNKRDNKTLLHIQDLKIHFPIRKGLFKGIVGHVKAVDGVSLTIEEGKTLALVGESGCGKTTVGKGILQLIGPIQGSVRFNGTELIGLKRKQLRQMRSKFQIVFQDPYSSLNPRMRILEIIEEGMNALKIEYNSATDRSSRHLSHSREKEVEILLQRVGLPPDTKWRFPHEFSGGQRQRIAIARALAVNPRLLICDEPTSALDVSVQAQILNLLKSLQKSLGLAYLFITHNISVVEYLADDIAVMYLGRIVERGHIEEVLKNPKHPYTQVLLSAVPQIESKLKREVIHLKGDLPSPANPPAGCHFHPRCPFVMPVCRKTYPQASSFSSTHTAHCYLYPQESSSLNHDH